MDQAERFLRELREVVNKRVRCYNAGYVWCGEDWGSMEEAKLILDRIDVYIAKLENNHAVQ